MNIAAVCAGLLSQLTPIDGPGYRFFPDTSRVVGVVDGVGVQVGRLDAAGTFHPVERIRKPTNPWEAILRSGPGFEVINGDTTRKTINDTSANVYEYRSGLLIPGMLEADGRFVTSVEKEAVGFTVYTFDSKSPPIWNLPGKLSPRGWKPVDGWRHANLMIAPKSERFSDLKSR